MTVRTPYSIARDAVDAMLSNPDSASIVRSFMVELMEDALRLSMTPDWDLEDNCSMTEHVVSTLAPSLSNITRDEVRRAADQFGLEVEDLDDPYRGIALEEEARIKAVRALHTGTRWPGVTDKPVCDACDQPWPCPTIRALDGDA